MEKKIGEKACWIRRMRKASLTQHLKEESNAGSEGKCDGHGNHRCKGPGVGAGLECLRRKAEARMTRADLWAEMRSEVTRISGAVLALL